MSLRSILVSVSVLLMGAVPASALVKDQIDSQSDFKRNKSTDIRIEHDCKGKKNCATANDLDSVFGQEGGGRPTTSDSMLEELRRMDLGKDGGNIKSDIYEMMARLGIHSDSHVGKGQEAVGHKEDPETFSVAGFCNIGECAPTLGQEGKGHIIGDPDVIQEGPYKGYRFIRTKITGGHDSRELIGPHDTDHAAAVGMVYCEKVVNGEVVGHPTTGTLVGDTQTVLASAHALFRQNKAGQKTVDFDYAEDCEYRKYQEDGRYYAYAIIYAKKGSYKGVGTHRNGDWSVLKLERKAYGQKYISIEDLNTNMLKEDSSYAITVIGHQHDKKNPDGTADNEGIYKAEGIMKATILPNGEKAYAHTADTNGRASGAAVVYTHNDGSKTIYGIHVAAFTDRDLNAFIPINSEILEAIRSVMRHNPVSI